MSTDKQTELAVALMRLGVSQEVVVDLLVQYPLDVIESQLQYLPYRRAKRKEAFIVEAIRKNYSPPKEMHHAKAKADLAAALNALDEDSKHPARSTDAIPQGYGTPAAPSADQTDDGLAAGQRDDHHDLPNFDQEIWS